MAEEAAVFWWVICRQRTLPVRTVTFITEFFRLLFVHGEKLFVCLIMWKFYSSLGRGSQEEEYYACPCCEEQDIVKHGAAFSTVFGHDQKYPVGN